MMSTLIAHTNQVPSQMCAVGGGEFVDVFEPTSLFRLSWTHPGSDVSAELVKQRALSEGRALGKTGMHYPSSVIALSQCRITGGYS